jgi:tetratricopeptide (TPR) repeat protein
VIEQQLWDETWNFDEPSLSEQRFLELLASQRFTSQTERDELTTQVARAVGLQGRFAEARDMLNRIDLTGDGAGGGAAAGTDEVVVVRVALELGRIENSSGGARAAIPHFERAVRLAHAAHLRFLEIDALHMLAIADTTLAGEWARRAIVLAEEAEDDRTRRWLVSLHNNLGWSRFEVGDLRGALAEFTRAIEWADAVGTPAQRSQARAAADECARALEPAAGA